MELRTSMSKIFQLDSDLINKIAAGEVIESAHSVIKELVENSLDAGAEQIEVQTDGGGLNSILVSDDGHGILESDIEIAIQRHTTSKIHSFHDLEKLVTYGFRGEALASVASISKMTLTTGTSLSRPSTQIYAESGKIQKRKNATGIQGTIIRLEELFFNTPVRKKFIKSISAEDRKIREVVNSIAIANPDKSFKLIQNKKQFYNLKPSTILERIISIHGDNLENHLIETKLEKNGIRAHGFISSPEFYRSNRMGQFFFVNKRLIEIKQAPFLLRKCYDEMIPPSAYPWCFLFFEFDPRHIDVNVHPTKKEIRFLDEESFVSFFLLLIHSALRPNTPMDFRTAYTRNVNSFSSHSSAQKTNQTQNFFKEKLYTNISPQASYPIESREENVLSEVLERKFIPKKHFGLLFETYILVEAEEGLYIIDQHTAHERIRYEELSQSILNKKYTIQKLLTPIRIDFSIQESTEILEAQKQLFEIGISLESFGDGTLLIRELPEIIPIGLERIVILDFFERYQAKKYSEIIDTMAKSIACHSAIKKGDHVSNQILSEIVLNLSYCQNPFQCPHGRPTMILLTNLDLDKMFNRK